MVFMNRKAEFLNLKNNNLNKFKFFNGKTFGLD